MDYAETKEMADRLGLRFDPEQNYVLADDYAFLPHLARGGNRYAFNVLFRNTIGRRRCWLSITITKFQARARTMNFPALIAT